MPVAVIVSLVKLRADPAGELNTMQARLNQLHADLASLDDVIKQFDPQYRLALRMVNTARLTMECRWLSSCG